MRSSSSAAAGTLLLLFTWCSITLADPSTFFFDGYTVGKNNRAAFGAVIRDLQSKFGHPVEYAFADEFKATRRMIYMGEKEFDRIVEIHYHLAHVFKDQERYTGRALKITIESIGRFIVAHEYFHSALLHLQLYDGVVPAGARVDASGAQLQELLELQADYLAAAYLILEDLPTKPLDYLLADQYDVGSILGLTEQQTDQFTDADWEKLYIPKRGYPRKRNWEVAEVGSALRFRWELFINDKLDCVSILGRYAALRNLPMKLALQNFANMFLRDLPDDDQADSLGLKPAPSQRSQK